MERKRATFGERVDAARTRIPEQRVAPIELSVAARGIHGIPNDDFTWWSRLVKIEAFTGLILFLVAVAAAYFLVISRLPEGAFT